MGLNLIALEGNSLTAAHIARSTLTPLHGTWHVTISKQNQIYRVWFSNWPAAEMCVQTHNIIKVHQTRCPLQICKYEIHPSLESTFHVQKFKTLNSNNPCNVFKAFWINLLLHWPNQVRTTSRHISYLSLKGHIYPFWWHH